MKTLKITSGWFRAAGNVYHWRQKFHVFGVGVNLTILKEEKEIQVEIEDDLYTLDCEKAKEFIKAHNSLKKVGRNRWVGVVSKSLLVPVKLAPVEEVSPAKIEKQEAQQGTLF